VRLAAVWAPVVLLIPLLAVYWIFVSSPATGIFHDDGIYIVTAKSLAERLEYRIESLPSDLPQSKYPILFPALLAALWKLSPGFPANVWLLKLLPALGALAVAIAIWRRARGGGLGEAAARWLALTWLAAPAVVFHATVVLPDTLFTLCCLTAILCLEQALANARKAAGWAAAAGLATGAALLLRSAGITLVPLGLFLVWKRRWRALGSFCIAAILLVGPWMAYQRDQPVGVTPVEEYYTRVPYERSHALALDHPGDAARMLLWNAAWVATSLGPSLGLGLHPVHLVTGLGLFLLAMAGLLRLFRAALWGPMEVWVLLYLGLLLVWSWPPGRYMIPVLPALLIAIASVVAGICRGSARAQLVLASALTACVASNAWFLAQITRETTATGWAAPSPGLAEDWTTTRRVFDWLRRETPQEAVIGANLDPMVYLYTGRKSIRLWHYSPLEVFYGVRTGAAFGGPERLRTYLLTHKVEFILLTPMALFGEGRFFRENLEALQHAAPEAFRTVAIFGRPDYAILRVQLEKLEAPPS
jgi:4-amino-4-deoxy-L-arabinose transferase-like glycosyltransferase